MDIGTKELRERLSAVLDRVARGEKVVVRRRGRPAALLVPLAGRGKGLPSLAAFRSRVRARGRPISADVIAARKDERA